MLRVVVGDLAAVTQGDGRIPGHCHLERGARHVGVPVKCRSICAEGGGVAERLQVDGRANISKLMRCAELDYRPKYESVCLEALCELHAHGAPIIITAANVAAEIARSRITLSEMSALEVVVERLNEGTQTRP